MIERKRERVMKLVLREYNVTPIKEKRDEVCVELKDNKVTVYTDDRVIEDNNKIDPFIEFIKGIKENIIKLNEERIQNYKGGRQKSINIQFDDEKVYSVIGNTPIEESVKMYEAIKEKLGEIIKE